MQIDAQVLKYLADLALALKDIDNGKVSYGEFYIERVSIGFDGESAGCAIIPNDYGGFDVEIEE